MRISSIYIDGYRRFNAQTIHLEGQSTVLAGSNNSGKTSLIDLLRVVLNAEGKFGADDLSSERRMKWFETIIDATIAGEAAYAALLEQEALLDQVPSIEVRLEVKYDPLNDDIRLFADYLMDLTAEKNSFYFQYRFSPRSDKLAKAYNEFYMVIRDAIEKNGWASFSEIKFGSSAFLALQTAIDDVLIDCSSAEAFFADHDYTTIIQMENVRSFNKLFNFKAVKASRTLDDTNEDRSGALNQRIIDVAKEDDQWSTMLARLPDQVLQAIEATGIRTLTSEETLKSLNRVIASISKTNGTSESDLFLDLQMTEDHAVQLISKAMQTRYMGGGVPLGEASQGLGYSNLIYLHLETESFIRSVSAGANRYLVNLVILEEPESHMHPQMQNAFIKHLFARVDERGDFQALVTTHSNEIIRLSEIKQLRVLKIEEGKCRIIDLRQFHEDQVKGKSDETQRLFSFLFAINFSDILFADKVIMYEGDTERMYIQALIKERKDLAGLRTQYISYVQVGGAYAHIYKPLIVDTLRLKTVIITDLDYKTGNETSNAAEVKALFTTNATLNGFFSQDEGGKKVSPTVGTLMSRLSDETGVANIQGNSAAAITFQSAREGYARTFEEAVLSTFVNQSVWETKSSKEWTEYRTQSKLKFSIPSKNESPSIRAIVASTSGSKTDFMYSLLLKEEFTTKVPPYILAALKWLNS